jgi:hypothetical protein
VAATPPVMCSIFNRTFVPVAVCAPTFTVTGVV